MRYIQEGRITKKSVSGDRGAYGFLSNFPEGRTYSPPQAMV